MRTIILLLLSLFSFSLNAQTKYTIVTVANTFFASSKTIGIGDTVEWTNTGGTHNVNGTNVTYPSNPESFGNAVGTGWVYTYVFNTLGTYDYQCDEHVGGGMVGEIIVEATSPVLVTSITVQGEGGVSTINMLQGTLQMEAAVLPDSAADPSINWSVANGTGAATINGLGLLTGTGVGTVTVLASALDGSSVVGTRIITISEQTTGIRYPNGTRIGIFPNPSTGLLWIHGSGTSESMLIYNTSGKIVQSESLNNLRSRVDISALPVGIYWIEIRSGKKSLLLEKIVKN